ncbi:MAG: murein L,D-transpeptidase [Candidatus Tectimicrobiota bacterium]
MSKRGLITLALMIVWGIGGGLVASGEAQTLANRVSEQIWERLLVAGNPPALRVAGEALRMPHLVARFYHRRLFWPAWSSETGFLPQADNLIRALREAELEGLRGRDYHLVRLEKLLAERRAGHAQDAAVEASLVAELELLLTDALLTYGSHGLYGRMTPRTSEMLFDTSEEKLDLVEILRQGVEANRIAEALHSLLPQHSSYVKLRQLLARTRQMPGSEARVRQILQNMERWRWLPQDLGRRYILVDVPAYSLEVIEREQPVMGMRVVVGKPSWPTPVLSATMSYVVLSPDWRVPPNIASQELLPILRANPAYLAQNNMRLSSGTRDIDPRSVDWSRVSAKNFPYRIRQEPGPRNPLGNIKFMFPNRFHVYLHDTSSRSLFAKPERAFSHGCVRVEKPTELAEYVLRGVLSRERIVASLGQRTSRTVLLPEPLPVYFVYRTVMVKEDGTAQFRPDIYGYDGLRDGGTL